MTTLTISNISDKVDIGEFTDFAYELPSIRKLAPDLPLDPEVTKVTEKYFNTQNNCNFIAFADQDDVPLLPWHIFDDIFDLNYKSFCIINQPPGQYINPHFDTYIGYCERNGVSTEHADQIQRHIIFLDDWHWGEMFCFPNNTFTDWKKGDVISWPYKTWHSTANAGLKNRVVLTITGVPKKIKQ